ncbi:hemerythrin domain-containing protein [Chloroflexota bacterium]
MEDTVALIDQLIKEHRVITRDISDLEHLANDVEAASGLKKAKEAFMPGRLDQTKGLQELQSSIEAINKGLDAHFNREETALLSAFEEHGDKELVSALHSLLGEHSELRNRMAQIKDSISELTSGLLGSHHWSASAHDMRVYISHTLKLIDTHAGSEYLLFSTLKNHLKQAGKHSAEGGS